MPRSHTEEDATVILANIEEHRQSQIGQNTLKRSGKVWSRDKRYFIALRCSAALFEHSEIKL